jgi:DNA-directed RNA polymerase subunit beta
MSYKVKKVNALVERRDYTKVSGNLPLPNLIELQLSTFDWFKKEGIQEVFDEVFPVVSNDQSIVLNMSEWNFREPAMDIKRAKDESKIFEAPIFADLTLNVNMEAQEIFKDIDGPAKTTAEVFLDWLMDETKLGESASVELKNSMDKTYMFEVKSKTSTEVDNIQIDIKDENEDSYIVDVHIYKKGEVFFGEFPIMTDRGTFVINGSEKVVVSQLVRSPGSYFKSEINIKTGEPVYSADIIPSRGTWLEFETDIKKVVDEENFNALFVKIDKSRKTSATSLLTSLGLQSEEVLRIFDDNKVIKTTYEQDALTGDFKVDWENQVQDIYKKIRQGETATADGASKFLYSVLFDKRKYDLTKAGRFKLQQKLAIKNRLIGRVLAEDIVDVNGKVAFAKDSTIEKSDFSRLEEVLDAGAMVENIKFSDGIDSGTEIQKVRVYRDNDKLSESTPVIGITANRHDEFINVPDIISTISYAINLMDGIGEVDDIDHLGNRRVRTVGELLQNQFRIGMMRIEKNVREKLTTSNKFKMKPSSVINNKPLTAIIGEFFNLSQLSQFMDQTNPLAELTNKRRLTALGPGGLSRDRAALEVRDVHPSHYGRICPIETPEGPNIGLINNLATYAKINPYGFIETPYRKVVDGVITPDHHYLTADREKNFIIAQANVKVDDNGKILDDQVVARYRGDDLMVPPAEVDYIDVSPKQIVSIATSCIPFLENDDANRALMGANMQRQAVPLIRPESPIVGTGVEFEAARDSGEAIVAVEDGVVKFVDATRITIESKSGLKTYDLSNFNRSNNGTTIIHKPIVKVGDVIKARDIIADGPSMDKGELALGQNVVVAFTTWNGYNYEDAVIVSERIVIDDRFTSIHIDEYTIERRQTKQGPEEITREIPNVSEASKKYLDEKGIVLVGSEVKIGDILVGKVTPKSQVQLSPEDKLLHAIFGEKSRNVKDNSLRVPNGGEGIVQSIKRFKREDGHDLPADILEIIKIYVVQKRKIQEGDKMAGRHGNKGVISKILPVEDMPHMADGTPVDIMLNPQGVPSRMNIGQVLEIHLGMAAKKLGIKVSTPVFEGVKENDLQDIMHEAGMTNYGKVELTDGRTGEKFDKPISVGVMYMLKLSHMVDDKLHARNIGPYSLITQQPLGGKAQKGGQRFGEMEVWALEAYGAAYTLREILTIKSDDIKGRIKTYESIVRSKPIPNPGIPESFNVLIKEIQGLGFDMHMIDEKGNKVQINAYDYEDDDYGYDDYSNSSTLSSEDTKEGFRVAENPDVE